MNVDALLFLQFSDIAHVCADPEPYRGLKQIFVDPGLLEEAASRGLDPADFEYRPLAVGRHFQAGVASEAMSRALALDRDLGRERSRLFGDGVFQGWDHVPLRFFFLRALIAKAIGELCDRQFAEPRVGLFRPSKPQQFYFDSYVSSDLFMGGSSRWRVLDSYDAVANWVPDAYAACLDFEWIGARAGGGSSAIVHIPTVYANLQHYAAEIRRHFPRLLELPSAFWDIPLGRDRCPLVRLGGSAVAGATQESVIYRERARAIIDRHLEDLITHPWARQGQVDMMADQCLVQAVNYLGLLKALAGTTPHFVLTEHDTGTIGPLFSVAERLGSRITVLPHSSYPTQPLPHSIRVRAIERDGFATPVRALWGERVETRAVRFAPRAQARPRQRVQTICLLLNTLSSRGISHIDLMGLTRFFRDLSQCCVQNGVRLVVRAKPAAACVRILSGALGVASEALQAVMKVPLPELAEASDLCLCFGEMTSGAIDFFEAGCHVMHVSEEVRPTDLLNASALASMQSLESVHGADALHRIERMLHDVAHFEGLAQRQRREFDARLTAAGEGLFDD
jgi:hypothetical protein